MAKNLFWPAMRFELCTPALDTQKLIKVFDNIENIVFAHGHCNDVAVPDARSVGSVSETPA